MPPRLLSQSMGPAPSLQKPCKPLSSVQAQAPYTHWAPPGVSLGAPQHSARHPPVAPGPASQSQERTDPGGSLAQSHAGQAACSASLGLVLCLSLSLYPPSPLPPSHLLSSQSLSSLPALTPFPPHPTAHLPLSSPAHLPIPISGLPTLQACLAWPAAEETWPLEMKLDR